MLCHTELSVALALYPGGHSVYRSKTNNVNGEILSGSVSVFISGKEINKTVRSLKKYNNCDFSCFTDHLTLKDLSVPVFRNQPKTQCGTLKVCPVQSGPVLPQTSGLLTLASVTRSMRNAPSPNDGTISACVVLCTALLAATRSL